jgi:hypothetical protein
LKRDVHRELDGRCCSASDWLSYRRWVVPTLVLSVLFTNLFAWYGPLRRLFFNFLGFRCYLQMVLISCPNLVMRMFRLVVSRMFNSKLDKLSKTRYENVSTCHS